VKKDAFLPQIFFSGVGHQVPLTIIDVKWQPRQSIVVSCDLTH